MSSKKPILSIIMPAYNAAPYIQEAIDSILNQTFTDFEFFISDDGSTDDTRRIIDSYSDPRITALHNTTNLGKTGTVNKLFKLTQSEFITVHDADDVSHPNRFTKQVGKLVEDEELMLCGTAFCTVDSDGFILEKNQMPTTYEEVLQGISKQSQFHGPTMVIRKSAIDSTELYRPYFRDNYEDTDLAYRIVEKGKAINLNDYLYIYRILDTSLCRKDVNVRNRNLYSVVTYLGNQRKQNGKDVVMQNMPHVADAYLEQITLKYTDDPALIYREAAAYYFYWRLYKKALQAARKGFWIRPFQLINLRTYFYVLRQTTIKIFKFDGESKKHYKETFG